MTVTGRARPPWQEDDHPGAVPPSASSDRAIASQIVAAQIVAEAQQLWAFTARSTPAGFPTWSRRAAVQDGTCGPGPNWPSWGSARR